MAKNLIKTIQNTAFRYELWKKGDKIVLGVSGGADSVCMLDIMAKIANKADLKLMIAHVNYGLRGKDSDKDEEFVRKLAEKDGIGIEVLKPKRDSTSLDRNDPKRSSLFKISENELREIRYEFFEKIRAENNFNSIAVAHNADDQVETFLMRVIRGAGLKGLAAMQYKSGKIIRPLLAIPRAEILKYLQKYALQYRTDKTNSQNIFFRNKIRNKLLPFLEKNFNPRIKKTLSEMTENIAGDYSLISSLAEKEKKRMEQLSVKKLLKLHPALQKEVARKFLAEVKNNFKDIEAAHIGEILKIFQSTKNKSQVVIIKGLKIIRKGDKVIISKLKIKSEKRKIKTG